MASPLPLVVETRLDALAGEIGCSVEALRSWFEAALADPPPLTAAQLTLVRKILRPDPSAPSTPPAARNPRSAA